MATLGRTHIFVAGAAIALGWSMAALADEVDFPCAGCVVMGEANAQPRPLLVLLHGDEGGPSRIVAAWRDVAAKRGMVLFAPTCPRALGCVGSYWQWDGDPKWLLDRVADVEAKYRVDATRRYLGGWSGGSDVSHVPSRTLVPDVRRRECRGWWCTR